MRWSVLGATYVTDILVVLIVPDVLIVLIVLDVLIVLNVPDVLHVLNVASLMFLLPSVNKRLSIVHGCLCEVFAAEHVSQFFHPLLV